MKFLCNRRDFLADCLLVSGGVSRDGITRNIKAIVESGHCTLMATDLEIGIRLEARVRVENDGAAILPAARLTDILREATDDEMMIDASAEKIVVRGITNEFEMPADVNEFPEVPAFAEKAYHQFDDVGELREMIRRTLYAAANASEVRYAATTGVLWELGADAALVATDGRRLARASGAAKAVNKHATTGMPVVPAKAMRLLERNLSAEGPVRKSRTTAGE